MRLELLSERVADIAALDADRVKRARAIAGSSERGERESGGRRGCYALGETPRCCWNCARKTMR